jgi:GMP synthase-like glutamine amidotransferase
MIIVFEHSDLSGVHRLGTTLRDFGHRLDVRRLHQGDEVPATLEGVDGVVSCGGAPDPDDDKIDWIAEEKAFIAAAHEADLPVVGICLGNQLVADALGGKIKKMKTAEIGWHPVTLTPTGCEDPILAGIAWSSIQAHWHSYEISKLPPGAKLLASSQQCETQAWGLGQRTYGFQYHPEIWEDTMDGWAEDDSDAVRAAGLTVESLREQTEHHYATCARLGQRLFESIALLLMPVDRRYEGVVKDLHH